MTRLFGVTRRPVRAVVLACCLLSWLGSGHVDVSASSLDGQRAGIDLTLGRPRSQFFETVLFQSGASQKASPQPENGKAVRASCTPTGQIEDACCDFQSVEATNAALAQRLEAVTKTDAMKFWKVDLYKECPFWREDGSCMNRACGVETTDESHIPEKWRAERLSGIASTRGGKVPIDLGRGCVYRETDFCVLDDPHSAINEGSYVDLSANPERFTGYAGHSANKVWRAIYEENCFGVPTSFVDPSEGVEQGGTGFASLGGLGHSSLTASLNKAAAPAQSPLTKPPKSRQTEMSELLRSIQAPRDGGDDETCLEKRVYYRLISGLHASISIHICDEYLDQKTGEWSPNLECFITRIAQHPERLQNVYFNYVLMLRALTKAGHHILGAVDDHQVREQISGLIREASNCPGTFDESNMFIDANAATLKEEFKTHFRNVSRIMDCVGCDKCRLWGKLQVTGLATALKLLFSDDETGSLSLARSEVVAFVNTLNRFSSSLAAVERFRDLWEHQERSAQHDKKASSPSAKSPSATAKRRKRKTRKATPGGSARKAQASQNANDTRQRREREASLLTRLTEACKHSAASCLHFIANLIASVTKPASSKADL
ncbi:uncharacterized protein L969DRAFT_87363 [Mixia osmundae IAM 14324]|uniref:Endoplasmic oxidoreductin 1 n=1 Tax=Mixia osmundae (strain CBS 9802 / IAM 14324 / JCM 22182 / KY 12970) TaxID=764103 RepID=G7E3L0_MIXOS|nr:uncharacterized protein L969DRAFT_87363 [Mixia osmundae IAM 14324]KEI39406.1 hypothetical protein L969DRAFT_87363 [Mixia osmundae IAM 14324]GAA97420.1 hypothetical protein E5Q_04098 [Mixia osmundae IAM 14324]